MLSRRTLENINEEMLGRGAPIERDEIGYNVADYNKLASIWCGATDDDLYEIASRLIKYYDTQLVKLSSVDFTKEELEESARYYKELSNEGFKKKSVTIVFKEGLETVCISFKYNIDFINVMRKYRCSFDREFKFWESKSEYIKPILEELKLKGADVEYAQAYIDEIENEEGISFTSSNLEDNKSLKEDKNERPIIKVSEVDEDYISLKFDYDNELIGQIKKLKVRNFDWDNKSWIVGKFEARTLYENILHLDYDFSELKPYTNDESIPRLKVVKVDDMDIEFSIPYYPDVIDRIKSLSYYRFNRPNLTWTIDIREKDVLISYIEKIVDCTELKEIETNIEKNKVKMKDYSYLKERKPFKHQVEAGEFLLTNRKAIIGDEMGSGKTMSSILASFSLLSPRLIICPASLKLNWAKEIRMVDFHGKICVIGDVGVSEGFDWYIINYDLLEREYEDLEKIKFTSITLDEAHYIKSVSNGGKPNSKRAKLAMGLAEKCEYVFSLTGTPITNKPKDIFNLLKISDHILSRNFFNFAQSYCGAEHNGYGWKFEGSSNEEELHDKIKPIMLRRLKSDMLDLPDKIRRFIPVEINMRRYNESVLEYLNKKNQLDTKGEHLAYLGAIKHILAQEKISSTIEIAENILAGDMSVVIFTNYNAVVNKLMRHFGDLATKITGSCSAKDREKAVEDFQSGRKKVMIANIIAGGVGITLIEANNLIFNDFDWVPANHFQAEDRIHRIGQTKKCTVNYIYVNGAEIDEYMAEMLERKSVYINKIIDGGKGEQLDILKGIINNLYKIAI